VLLRRVIQHVRRQEWTAVVLDLIIVVVGVFIGIQVANWNDARGEAERREQLLEDLARDVRDDLEELAQVKREAEWRFSAVDAILRDADVPIIRTYPGPNGNAIEMATAQSFDRDVPLLAITAMFWVSTLDNNQRAYETLISTGDYRLIGDPELTDLIQSYFANVDEYHEFEDGVVNARDRTLVVAETLGVGMGSDVSLEELVALVEGNASFGATLATQWIYDDEHRTRNAALAIKGEALLTALEARN